MSNVYEVVAQRWCNTNPLGRRNLSQDSRMVSGRGRIARGGLSGCGEGGQLAGCRRKLRCHGNGGIGGILSVMMPLSYSCLPYVSARWLLGGVMLKRFVFSLKLRSSITAMQRCRTAATAGHFYPSLNAGEVAPVDADR